MLHSNPKAFTSYVPPVRNAFNRQRKHGKGHMKSSDSPKIEEILPETETQSGEEQ